MTIVDEFRRDEGRVLDRLADGELSQRERRELLAALDDEPGAWRRCALAFLEAQSWRWQLAQLAAEPADGPPSQVKVAQATAASNGAQRVSSTRRNNRGTLWGACLVMAASLLVAFGLGTRFPTAGEPQFASVPANANAVTQPDKALANLDVDTPPAATSSGPAVESANESPWETLTLALADDAGNAEPRDKIEVRVREADADGANLSELLTGQPSTVAGALIEQLEQEGWQVTRERRLLPVDLSDGRRMIVPVEQVDMRYPEVAKF